MPTLRFFCAHEMRTKILSEIAIEHQLKITLLRGAKAPIEYMVVPTALKELSAAIDDEKPEWIYISLNEVPRTKTDYGFIDRAAPELLDLWGGRKEGRILQICHLRTVNKITKMLPIYKKFRKRILSVCTVRGIQNSSNQFDNTIYYDPNLKGLELRSNLDRPDSRYVI